MKLIGKRIGGIIGGVLLVLLMMTGRQVEASGYHECGDYARWYIDDKSLIMYIEGQGAVDRITWKFSSSNKELDAYDATHVVIDPRITELPAEAFRGCSKIQTVTMGDMILELKGSTFYNCSSLKSIQLSKNVRTIGESCFSGCKSLQEITLPEKIEECGKDAFSGTNIKKAVFPSGTTTIPESIFKGMTTLTDVIVPDTVKKIGDYAFCGCKDMKAFLIPSRLEELGAEAISGCKNMTKIKMPKTLKKEDRALLGSYVDTVEVESGIKEITYKAFYGANYVKKIVIPDTVTRIAACAFGSCLALQEVKLSKNLYSMDGGGFCDCPSLKKVEIPASLTFSEGGLLKDSKVESVTFLPGRSMIQPEFCSDAQYLKEVNLPNTITTIPSNAFENCKSLTSIVLPENINVVAGNAFYNCNNLRDVYIKNPQIYLASGWNRSCGVKTLYGSKGSKAELWAQSLGISFVEKYRCVTACSITLPSTIKETGASICPLPEVKDGSTSLVRGRDYTVSYRDNVKPGVATVVISGIGETYVGSITKTFKIQEKERPISKCSISLPKEVFHTGKALTPAPVIKYGNETLKSEKDYKVQYRANKNLGRATVVITGIGSRYQGSVTRTFAIVPAKNERYVVGGITYKVNSAATNGKGRVSIVSIAKGTKKVTIPKTVKIGGYTYQVTSIEKNAFAWQKQLTYIDIKSENISYIGSKAFYKIGKNAKIKVPKRCYSKYQKMIKQSKIEKTVKIIK